MLKNNNNNDIDLSYQNPEFINKKQVTLFSSIAEKNIFQKIINNPQDNSSSNLNSEWSSKSNIVCFPRRNFCSEKTYFSLYENEKTKRLYSYSREYHNGLWKNNFLAFAVKDDLSDYSISLVNKVILKCENVVKEVYVTNFSFIKKLDKSQNHYSATKVNSSFDDVKIFLIKNCEKENCELDLDEDAENENNLENNSINTNNGHCQVKGQIKFQQNADKENVITNNNNNITAVNIEENQNPSKKKKRYRRTKAEMIKYRNELNNKLLNNTHKSSENKPNIPEANKEFKTIKQENNGKQPISIINNKVSNINIVGETNSNKDQKLNLNLDGKNYANNHENDKIRNAENIEYYNSNNNNNRNENLYNNEITQNICIKDIFSNESGNLKNYYDEEMQNELENNKIYFNDNIFECVNIINQAQINNQFSELFENQKNDPNTHIAEMEQIQTGKMNIEKDEMEPSKAFDLETQDNNNIVEADSNNRMDLEKNQDQENLAINLAEKANMMCDTNYNENGKNLLEYGNINPKKNLSCLNSLNKVHEIIKKLEEMKVVKDIKKKEIIFLSIIENYNTESLNLDQDFLIYRCKLLKYIYNHGHFDIFKDPISKRLIFPLLDILYLPVNKTIKIDPSTETAQNSNLDLMNNPNLIDIDRYINFTPKNYNEGESTIYFLSYLNKENDFNEKFYRTLKFKTSERDNFARDQVKMFIENKRSFNNGIIDIFSDMTTGNFNFFKSIGGQLIYDNILTPLGVAVNTLNDTFYSGMLIPNFKSNKFISLNRNFNLILPFSNPAVITLTKLYLGVQKCIFLLERKESLKDKNMRKCNIGNGFGLRANIDQENYSKQLAINKKRNNNDFSIMIKASNSDNLGINNVDFKTDLAQAVTNKIFNIQKIPRSKVQGNNSKENIFNNLNNNNILHSYQASLINNFVNDNENLNNVAKLIEGKAENKDEALLKLKEFSNMQTTSNAHQNQYLYQTPGQKYIGNNIYDYEPYNRRFDNSFTNNLYVGIIWNREELLAEKEKKNDNKNRENQTRNINFSSFSEQKKEKEKTRKFIKYSEISKMDDFFDKLSKKYDHLNFQNDTLRASLKEKIDESKAFKNENNELIKKLKSEINNDEKKIENFLVYLRKKRNRKMNIYKNSNNTNNKKK